MNHTHTQTEEEVRERISALAERETRYVSPQSSAEHSGTSCEEQRLSPTSVFDHEKESSFVLGKDSRRLVCDWMYRVVDHYSLERETIPIGMSYFDRYIAKHPIDCSSKERCQLISVTSLYIAVKLYDIRRKDTIEFFSKLSGDRFSTSDIQAMEQKILPGLNWYMNPPTPQSFIYNFVHLLSTILPKDVRKCMTTIYEVANYITEVSLLHPSLGLEKASTLAFASFLVAIREVKTSVISTEHYEDIVSSLLAFNFTNPDEVVAVADDIVKSLHANDGHLNLHQIYDRLDPEQTIYDCQ
jgi:hypothetical protein